MADVEGAQQALQSAREKYLRTNDDHDLEVIDRFAIAHRAATTALGVALDLLRGPSATTD